MHHPGPPTPGHAGNGLRIESTTINTAHRAMVRVAGDLDASADIALNNAVVRLLSAGCVDVVIDLSEVRFCDARGVNALLGIDHCLRLLGGRFALAAAPPGMPRMLTAAGADPQRLCFSSPEEALVRP